jgi:hypothetical protein
VAEGAGERPEVQMDELDTLDRKATTVLAGTGVLLGLVVNNLDRFPNPAVLAASVAFYGSLLLLALGLLAGLWTLWPRRIQVIPHPPRLVEQYYSRHPDDTLPEILSTRTQGWKDNVPAVDRKSRGLKFQISLLAAGGVLLVAACILNKVV